MAIREDVKYEAGDMVINTTTNDVEIVEAETQHIGDTIEAPPGSWPEHPGDGVGVAQYLGASGEEQTLARNIKINLQADGYQVNSPVVEITNETVNITPNATRV